MKKITILLITWWIIGPLILIYGLGALIQTDYKLENWPSSFRFLISLIYVAISFFGIFDALTLNKNEPT